MAERDFSPGEVEALIPLLTTVLDDLRLAHANATQAREDLHGEQQRLAMAGGGILDRTTWQQAKERLERETQRLERAAAEITKMGGVIKDVGMGLVDFPHRREGRVVNLCWKYGETEIRYWHGLDEGFAARKPL